MCAASAEPPEPGGPGGHRAPPTCAAPGAGSLRLPQRPPQVRSQPQQRLPAQDSRPGEQSKSYTLEKQLLCLKN